MDYDLRHLQIHYLTLRFSFEFLQFFAGFYYALKSSEDYYDKLEKTQLADDDFTREYLQEISNEI